MEEQTAQIKHYGSNQRQAWKYARDQCRWLSVGYQAKRKDQGRRA